MRRAVKCRVPSATHTACERDGSALIRRRPPGQRQAWYVGAKQTSLEVSSPSRAPCGKQFRVKVRVRVRVRAGVRVRVRVLVLG